MSEGFCAVDDCFDPIRSKGLCGKHYLRWYRHGDPLVGGRVIAVPNESYWRVDPSTGCWLWTKAINRQGYGQRCNQGAHRWVFEHFRGPIPSGMMLDHRCHTDDKSCAGGPTCIHRRCVNPDHLDVVDHYENQRRSQKGVCIRGHQLEPFETCRECQKQRNAEHLERKRAR